MANVAQKSFDKFRKILSRKLESIIPMQTEFNNKLDGISYAMSSLRTENAARDIMLNKFENTLLSTETHIRPYERSYYFLT